MYIFSDIPLQMKQTVNHNSTFTIKITSLTQSDCVWTPCDVARVTTMPRTVRTVRRPNCRSAGPPSNFHLNDRVHITIMYKSVPFTEKRPRKPETGIKGGFEETRPRVQFRLKRSVRKNKTVVIDVPLRPEIFR